MANLKPYESQFTLGEVKEAFQKNGLGLDTLAQLVFELSQQKIQVTKAWSKNLIDPRTGNVVYKKDPISGQMVPLQQVAYETAADGRERKIEIVEEQVDARVAKEILQIMQKLLIQEPAKESNVNVGLQEADRNRLDATRRALEANPELIAKIEKEMEKDIEEAVEADFEEMD